VNAALLNGKRIADGINERLKSEVRSFQCTPMLVAVEIGNNDVSRAYLSCQKKQADILGIRFMTKSLPAAVSEEEACAAIRACNEDSDVTAVIVQLPVPKHIDCKKLIEAVRPDKDAEGMHPENLGRLVLGGYTIGPCTALAVIELLKAAGIELYGKEVVCIGHSEIVGKPLSLMMLDRFATTTVCHIATDKRGLIPEHVQRAEVLIVAVGKPGLIKGEWIREGAIVIDVGMNRVGARLVGDVAFDEASRRAKMITPVPGGVGPLTTVMLMRNVIE